MPDGSLHTALLGLLSPGVCYSRRNLAARPGSGISLAAAQLLCATVQLAVVVPFLGAAPRTVSADAVLSLVALGLAGTGLAYVLNHRLIRTVGPAVASTATYVVPLFAPVLGIGVLGDGLLWHEPVGACVVLAGVAISSGFAPRSGVRSQLGRGAVALPCAQVESGPPPPVSSRRRS